MRLGARGIRVGRWFAPLRAWHDVREVVAHRVGDRVRVAVHARSGSDAEWLAAAQLAELREKVHRWGGLPVVERPVSLDDRYHRWRAPVVALPAAGVLGCLFLGFASGSVAMAYPLAAGAGVAAGCVVGAVEARVAGQRILAALAMVAAFGAASAAVDFAVSARWR